jgi:restriction system protein
MLLADPRFEEIDRMTAPEFEAAVVALLELAGYDDVVASGGFKGKGVDLMAGADGERTAVQATRSAHPVGVAAVRALIDGRKRLGCERGLAVTNNFFWPEAEQCAAEWEVELWDRWKLALFVDGPEPQIDDTICAECRKPVPIGVTAFCLSLPARFQGQVFCIAHQKKQIRAA